MSSEQLKESVKQILVHWEQQKPELEKMYAIRDERRIGLLQLAIDQLTALVENSGTEENTFTGKTHFMLAPNNYQERIDFIRMQHTSHYALIQLTMLYDEVKKKAARLRVQQ
ncbi:hypothetical protein ORD22_05430 [Sporosarcina sp. GW1-11]|uniref:YpoC family protein n=1 Tax=Sporosarcina sp. GW1-11 TaxID=2899126 RepID=UPI00294E9CC9|nr:hypothetical protein [Sporosarcina sp. GW1-11]MDV6377705.1 hypothetical protein [Sporosarcina sp. GW1-11]